MSSSNCCWGHLAGNSEGELKRDSIDSIVCFAFQNLSSKAGAQALGCLETVYPPDGPHDEVVNLTSATRMKSLGNGMQFYFCKNWAKLEILVDFDLNVAGTNVNLYAVNYDVSCCRRPNLLFQKAIFLIKSDRFQLFCLYFFFPSACFLGCGKNVQEDQSNGLTWSCSGRQGQLRFRTSNFFASFIMLA